MSAPGPDKIWGFRIKTKKHGRITTNEEGEKHHYTAPKSIQNWKNAKEYFKTNILINDKLLSGGSGIYTWILKADNFYAIKVTTPQEIGTLHFLLDDLTVIKNKNRNEPVILAGELEIKDDKSIVFNLESGSYTLPLIRGFNELDLKSLSRFAKDEIIKMIRTLSKSKEYIDLSQGLTPEDVDEISESIKQMMVEKFRVVVTYDGRSFIDGANIRTSMNDIRLLNRYFTKNAVNPNEQQGGKRRTHRRHQTKKTRKSRK